MMCTQEENVSLASEALEGGALGRPEKKEERERNRKRKGGDI